MERRTRNVKPFTRLALCVCLSIPAVGCVYGRLNRFRNQLSAFPDHFRVETGERPTVRALSPVLRFDDWGWLTGLPASETVKDGENSSEIYRFGKQAGKDPDERPGEFDLILILQFNARGRLELFQAPARFATILTEENFDKVFRPMKDGSVDSARRATGWTWEDHQVNIPSRADILHFFGKPSETENGSDGTVYRYAYRLEGGERQWNPTGWDAYAAFTFDPETDQVINVKAYKGRMRISVDMRGNENVAEIERLGK